MKWGMYMNINDLTQAELWHIKIIPAEIMVDLQYRYIKKLENLLNSITKEQSPQEKAFKLIVDEFNDVCFKIQHTVASYSEGGLN